MMNANIIASPLPKGPYKVVYADPPWMYGARHHRGPGKGAAAHYKSMKTEEICAMPVAEIADRDSALFLWVVQPMLPDALRVIEAWGYKFKTVAYCWIKIKGGQDRLFYAGEDVKKGLGYHTRSGCEQCWLAVRGKGYERMSQGEAQVVFSPLRQHSRKPDEIRESIEQLTGDVSRVELFARTRRPGWDVWGNQVDKFQGAA